MTETQKERENSNSKTLILKDISVRSIWTYLTASPCYTTNTNKHDSTTKRYYKTETETERERGGGEREKETERTGRGYGTKKKTKGERYRQRQADTRDCLFRGFEQRCFQFGLFHSRFFLLLFICLLCCSCFVFLIVELRKFSLS